MTAVPGENRVSQTRIQAFLAAMVVLFVIFIGRLIFLQVIQGGSYLALADNNRTQQVSIPASRGVIYDRNGIGKYGVILARNLPSYNITITPANLPDTDADIQAVYRELSALTGVPIRVPGSRPSQECAAGRGIADLVDEWIELAPYSAVKILCNADPSVAMSVQEKEAEMPGVGVEVTAVRDYPNGRYTADVIGYVGRIPSERADEFTSLGYNLDTDKIGYAGLEASMQEVLAGKYGSLLEEVDAAGKEIRLLAPPAEPVPGANIITTIDARLQEAATNILERQIDRTRANKPDFLRSPMITGVVIAMNPQTGEILAMVSVPTYDNEQFTHGIPAEYYNRLVSDISNPLLNKAISGTYPPGSVFKMTTAIGALNQNVVTPQTKVLCTGSISILQKFFPTDPGKLMPFYCWDRAGHGEVDYLKGVSQSCDVYFYNLGGGFPGGPVETGLGISGIKKYAEALGYGQKLGIELYGESAGLIPDPDWKRINKGENWATGDTYISTIGQGYVLATPLQVLESIATIANGGKLMKPTLIRELIDGEGNVLKPFEPTVIRDLGDGAITDSYDLQVEPWVFADAQEGMREVVATGTAMDTGKIDNIPTAGKTGTAEYCDDIAQLRNLCQRDNWPTHAWYAAYAPPVNPEIAVVAFVYDGGEGAVTAAPVVRDVIQAYYEFKNMYAGSGG